MGLIADILLIAAALGAAVYCLVLSRRLTKLARLDDGVGGAISGLSDRVSEMTAALDRAQSDAKASSETLEEATRRAEAAARQLELLLASLHDLPEDRATDAANVPSSSETDRYSQARPSAPPTFRRRFSRSPRNEAAE